MKEANYSPTKKLTQEGRRIRRLILAAVIFHMLFTSLLLGIGRAELLPEMFNQDGLGKFASDSYRYMREVRELVDVLGREGISAFVKSPIDFHLKLYALSAFILSPIFGFTVLGIELLNMLCFAAVVVLGYALGREIFNRNVAILAALAVGLWPSFLLFTTQLYKTPLIVMLILALVWVNVRLITRQYQARSSLIYAFSVFFIILVLKIIRSEWWLFAILITIMGIVSSILQMIFDRRAKLWKLITIALMLVSILIVSNFTLSESSYDTTIDAFEEMSPLQNQEPGDDESMSWWSASVYWADSMARRLGVYRYSFRSYALHAGSNIDTEYVITEFSGFIRYLPRAAQIGFWAPFPSMWYVPGAKLGLSARVLSGLETLLMYFVELIVLLGIWRARKRISAWYIFLVAAAGIVALGLVVPNVGALYRFRFPFWMLLIILGTGGAHYIVVPGTQLFWANVKGGVKKIIDSDIAISRPVLLVANWDWVLYNFRLPLAKALQENGLDVVLVCPPGRYTEEIKSLGFQWKPWNLDRRSIYPWRELYSIFELYRIYRDMRPAAVHHFTIKPILYGSVVARMAKITPVINNFTGLGYLFSDASKARFLRKLLLPILKQALHIKGFHTAFQNEHDLNHLVSLGIISAEDTTLIPGTGVDLTRYKASKGKKTPKEPLIVIMAARLLWDKGLAEFVEAAREIRRQGISANFWLAGAPDPGNLACVPEDVLGKWREEGIVELLGHRTDIPYLLQEADIAVLPSYHEGVPLFLLEAAASGLPLVGSDIEGCRMIIDNGRNGYLVEKGDATGLTHALKNLLADPDLRQRMGFESRRIAEGRFDQRSILTKYLNLYQKLNLLQGIKDSPVLLVANWDWVLYNFRLPLATALEENGLSVILVCPPGKYTDEIQQLGYHWQPWDLNRRSIYPWREAISIIELYKIYRRLNPVAVHHFTIKPILYGSLAARAADVPRVINNFTGLGYLFSRARKAALLRRIVLPVLRRALQVSSIHTAFQNAHDRAHLVSLGIVSERDTTLIPGTGVDLTQYKPSSHQTRRPGPPVVIMAARLLWDKGVAEYVAAAKAIHNQGIEARFLLAGEPDHGNPDSVPGKVLEEWKREGVVEVLGHRSDIPALLQDADIAVLPSSYHEGVPLFLLEAAATGLALIGSDIEGCRMVIEHGENGFLVPKRDAESLTQALTKLLANPDLRREMGRASRRVAESRFDQRLILNRYINMYQEMKLLSV